MKQVRSALALLVLLGAGCAGSGGEEPGLRPGGPPPEAGAAPPGMRLVGLGHAAVTVPEQWQTNATRCGVPQQDTVVIDVAAVPACGTARPKGVDSVELTRGAPGPNFRPREAVSVGGVRVRRGDTTCSPGGFGGPRVCASTVYVPSMRVAFHAESSTSAGQVDRILSRIRVLPGLVGVPGYQTIALDHQERSGQQYVKALRDAGLEPRVRARATGRVPPGFVLHVAPQPGTMVPSGSTVTVTVVGDASGP